MGLNLFDELVDLMRNLLIRLNETANEASFIVEICWKAHWKDKTFDSDVVLRSILSGNSDWCCRFTSGDY